MVLSYNYISGNNWAVADTTPVPAINIAFSGGCFGNSIQVLGGLTTGGQGVAISYDGRSWSLQTCPKKSWQAFCYGAGTFVGVANDVSTTDIMTSSNAISWSSQTTPTDTSRTWKSICYGNGTYVAIADGGVGSKGRAITSNSGLSWTDRTTANDGLAWTGIVYGGNTFVAISNSGTGRDAQYTKDGITWYQSTTVGTNQYYSIAYGAGKFVTAPSAGSSIYSVDGVNWTRTSCPNTAIHTGISYKNGVFMAMANSGDTYSRVSISFDGVNWQKKYTPYSQNYLGQSIGNPGMCIAYGLYSTTPHILYSKT